MAHNHKRSIVLLTLGGLGDAILFSPLFNAVKSAFPEHNIVLIAANRLVEQLYGSMFNKVFTINSDAKDFALVRQIIEIKKFIKNTGKVELLISAPRMSSLWVQAFNILLTPKANISATKPTPQKTDLQLSMEMAKKIAPQMVHSPYVPISSEAIEHTKEILLRKFNVPVSAPKIIIYPSRARWNRPLISSQILLEASLYAKCKLPDSIIIVAGSYEEKKVFLKGCGDIKEVQIVAGELTIQETAALCSMSRLVIANDGSIIHMAGALNIPLVALMPNTSHIHTPPGKYTIVISPNKLECSPCYPHRPKWCLRAKNEPLCITKISIQEIKNAIDKVFE